MQDEEILRLIQDAYAAPSASTSVELLLGAIHLADTRQNLELGIAARKQLMAAALTAGRPEEIIAAFSWCLGQSDRRPDQVPIESLLWEYRWVVSRLPHFPDISLDRIDEAIADMTRRYREAGSTLRPVHLLTLNTAIQLNNQSMADRAYQEWLKAPSDRWSDDRNTEKCFILEYLVFSGQDEEAIRQATHVRAGRVEWDHTFGQDCAQLLAPLLKAGRIEEARMVPHRTYHTVDKDQMLDMVGRHVEFLARLDEFDEAAAILEKHATRAVRSKLLLDRLCLFRAALLLVLRLLPRVGHALKMPSEIPVMRIGGKCRLDELEAWLRDEIAETSRKFDSRNRNTYLMDQLHEVDRLAALPVPVEAA